MARNKQLLQQRNARVHELIQQYKKRNPKWQFVFIVEAVAKEMYLQPLTIQRILQKPATVEVPANQMAMF